MIIYERTLMECQLKLLIKIKYHICLICKREIELINFLPKEKQIKSCVGNRQKISQGNNDYQNIVSNMYNTTPNYNFVNISNIIPNYNYQNIDSNNKINNQNIVSNISNIIPDYNSQNINNQKIDPNDKIQNNLPNHNIQTKNNNNDDELTNISDQCKNTNNNKNTPKKS